jgi:antitoxin component YwqK of YwqJK toxin-antitoxin module
MKNKFLILALIILIPACANKAVYSQGALDSAGKPTGLWNIYQTANGKLGARGEFINGEPNGHWELWENTGCKVADLNFNHGKLDGKYVLFYGCNYAGADHVLKTIGHASNGVYVGSFERYYVNGDPVVKYQTDENENVVNVTFGTKSNAESQLNADKSLMNYTYMPRIRGEF